MNKVTKGALAAAAGAAILAGGAGTMAAWNSNASLGGGQITAGTLNIEQVPGSGSWHRGTVTGAAFNPNTETIVPGDVVVYVADYEVTAVGENLHATLTPNLGNVTGDLAEHLVATKVGNAPTTVEATATPTTYQIGTAITFKDVDGEIGQGKAANLSGATVTLQQTTS